MKVRNSRCLVVDYRCSAAVWKYRGITSWNCDTDVVIWMYLRTWNSREVLLVLVTSMEFWRRAAGAANGVWRYGCSRCGL